MIREEAFNVELLKIILAIILSLIYQVVKTVCLYVFYNLYGGKGKDKDDIEKEKEREKEFDLTKEDIDLLTCIGYAILMALWLINLYFYLMSLFDLFSLSKSLDFLRKEILWNDRMIENKNSIIRSQWEAFLKEEKEWSFYPFCHGFPISFLLFFNLGFYVPLLISVLYPMLYTSVHTTATIWNLRFILLYVFNRSAENHFLKERFFRMEKSLMESDLLKEIPFRELPLEEGTFFITKLWWV